MVEPFHFRDNILDMIGGTKVLLEETDKRLLTHRITQASDASRIPVDDVRRHVIRIILQTCQDRLAEPLTVSLKQHLDNAVEEYKLFEGPPSSSKDDLWFQRRHDYLCDAMKGEVEGLLGPNFIHEQVEKASPPSVLVQALLTKPVEDSARALAALGVTVADIELLVNEVRRIPRKDPVFTIQNLADLVRAKLDQGGDLFEIDEALRDPTVRWENLSQLLVGDDSLADKLVEFELNEDPETFADAVIALATAPQTMTDGQALAADEQRRQASPAAAQDIGRVRPGRQKTEPGALTEPAVQALEAMLKWGGPHDAHLAKRLEISRATLTNYRSRKFAWVPTAAQVEILLSTLKEHAEHLANAANILELSA